MIGLLQKALAFRHILHSRAFAVGILSTALASMILAISCATKAVYIRDGEEVTLKFTMEQDVDSILNQTGINTAAYDVINFTGFNGGVGEIDINRAFPVSMTVDGGDSVKMVTQMTVDQFLSAQRIDLGEEDIINYPLNYVLGSEDHIVIQRVEYVTRVEEEPIEHDVKETLTSLLPKGRVHVEQKGKDGVKERVYIQRTIDGEVHEEELLKEEIVEKPVAYNALVGTPSAPVSPLDFGYEIVDGAPSSYSYVINEAHATGYSANYGAGTASGKRAAVGYVAVNPTEIPYGSKLYITSPDHKFVYGYAVAADTGLALIDGTIDIDLFYNSYYESCLNGRRIVDVYVLE